jgi:hypothetical protein
MSYLSSTHVHTQKQSAEVVLERGRVGLRQPTRPRQTARQKEVPVPRPQASRTMRILWKTTMLPNAAIRIFKP